MTIKDEKSYSRIFYMLLFGSLIFYVFFRAWNLSFTHDESLSYAIIKGDELRKNTANYHVLNTWLMKVFAETFGEKEIFLRLPNVLAFLLYLSYCYKILTASTKPVYAIIGIPLLLLNPFVLDFFSLARGYGLSLGFMMASLYYFLRKDHKEHSYKTIITDFALCLLFAALAMLSNISLLNFYLAVLGLITAQYILFSAQNKYRIIRGHLFFLFLFLLACMPLFPEIKRLLLLKENDELYFGAEYFGRTIMTLLDRTYYFAVFPAWFSIFIKYFILLIFPLGATVVLIRRDFTGPLARIILLISLIVAGLLLEHILFGALFPEGRTGIYFIPLFGLFLHYLFTGLIQNLTGRKQTVVLIIALTLFTLPLSIHFLSRMNLKYTLEWRWEAGTRDVVRYLDERSGADKSKTISLSYNWGFEPALNYYVQSGRRNFELSRREERIINSDFLYESPQNFNDSGWKAVLRFEDAGTALYEKIAAKKTFRN